MIPDGMMENDVKEEKLQTKKNPVNHSAILKDYMVAESGEREMSGNHVLFRLTVTYCTTHYTRNVSPGQPLWARIWEQSGSFVPISQCATPQTRCRAPRARDSEPGPCIRFDAVHSLG